jgi:hypothetical protein
MLKRILQILLLALLLCNAALFVQLVRDRWGWFRSKGTAAQVQRFQRAIELVGLAMSTRRRPLRRN